MDERRPLQITQISWRIKEVSQRRSQSCRPLSIFFSLFTCQCQHGQHSNNTGMKTEGNKQQSYSSLIPSASIVPLAIPPHSKEKKPCQPSRLTNKADTKGPVEGEGGGAQRRG